MLYAAALIPVLNATGKYLVGQDYSVVEVTWFRYAGHFFWMVISFGPSRGPRLLRTAHPVMQFVRSSLLFCSTLIYFTALGHIPLATAAAIGFLAPFIVTGLSPFVLGEAVGVRRWTCVGFGFLGALIVIRPAGASFDPATLLVFGSASCSAAYQLLTRKLAAFDPAETSITWLALAGFLLASVALPFAWRMPASPWEWLLFGSLGFFGGFGHYFMVRAFEMAPAPAIAPLNYAQLLGAVLFGLVVFGQFPDFWTWVGSATIVGTGVYLIFRERRLSPRSGGTPRGRRLS